MGETTAVATARIITTAVAADELLALFREADASIVSVVKMRYCLEKIDLAENTESRRGAPLAVFLEKTSSETVTF
jgi:hypothetical protein